jgi:hypothetical protein
MQSNSQVRCQPDVAIAIVVATPAEINQNFTKTSAQTSKVKKV